jgi:hypothetical protein
MTWPVVAPPDKIYGVSLDGPALQARVLQESTRLRDAFPTRSFGFGNARPLMIVPYTDGFDLIHFPIGQHPYAWLSVKSEVLGSRCRMHVSRRRRPRPERIIFVVFPAMIALLVVSTFLSDSSVPPTVPFMMVVPFVLIAGVMNYQERRQERRLLQLLGTMFPGVTDETATRI